MCHSRIATCFLVVVHLSILPLAGLAQNDWNLPHKQSQPLKSPDAGPRQKLKDRIVDRLISRKQTGFFSDKSIILGIHREFELDDRDKDRLRKAGFADDVIADIDARGRWRHPVGPQPLKNTTIREQDSLFHNLVKANNDKLLRAELIDVWEGLCHIDFINQTDHFVDLHYLAFDKGTRNVSFVSDLRHNDEDPLSSNVLDVMRYNSSGRFGQKLTDYYHRRIFPHSQNTDKSRYDIWRQNNAFVGKSSAFTDSKFQTPPANPASLLKTGEFVYHYPVHAESALDPGPITVDSFYCYSYRDDMDNLVSRCAELQGACNKGKKEQPEFELGLTADVEIDGAEMELAALPFNLPRNIAKDGLGSGLYKTGLVTYKIDKDKAGKEHVFVYMLDADPAHNPREKFYVSLTLYPSQSDNLLGRYELSEESDNQIAAGILISEFHFSNHAKVRGQDVGKLNIESGYVDILSVTDEAIFGRIELKAGYTFKLSADYNQDDDCHPGMEDEAECNPVYRVNISDAEFGAKKR